mmetsp:Transcript_5221/g.7698  ORF Transcript_5221/g.7698 Transcript_5221/m.7698 type:complete len:209 (-) Transcript_5221:1769-2395(-)
MHGHHHINEIFAITAHSSTNSRCRIVLHANPNLHTPPHPMYVSPYVPHPHTTPIHSTSTSHNNHASASASYVFHSSHTFHSGRFLFHAPRSSFSPHHNSHAPAADAFAAAASLFLPLPCFSYFIFPSTHSGSFIFKILSFSKSQTPLSYTTHSTLTCIKAHSHIHFPHQCCRQYPLHTIHTIFFPQSTSPSHSHFFSSRVYNILSSTP